MASALSSTSPLLHVVLPAQCEVTAAGGRGQKYEGVGIALDSSAGLCIAVGGEKKMATFATGAVQRVHAKFLGSGKLTFEVGAGRQGVKQLLVSRAQPEDLRGLLGVLDEASKRAKQRGVAAISQDEAVALLQAKYPEQVKKQLAKLREAVGSDSPVPLKGHTRLMLVVEAVGQSASHVGKAVCKLAEGELKLTSHPRPGESNAQSYKAVCKDAADKSTQIELRVRECTHHRFKKALWIDLELGEKVFARPLPAP